MQIVIASVLLVALFFLLPQSQIGAKRTLGVLKECDWPGIFLFMIGTVLCLIPINVGGSMAPWSSPLVIGCLVTGISSLLLLALHQRFYAKHPAFPREIFNKAVTNAAFLGSLISGMLLSMIFYNLVLFWEGVRHLSTIKIGVMLLSVTLTYTLSAAVTGIMVKIWGQVRWASVAGTFCAVVGLGLMYLLDDVVPVPPIIIISMIAAAGCGIMVPAVINTVLASTEKAWHGHAIAMRTLLYTAGQCIGISVGLAIFTNKFQHHLVRAEGTGNFVFTPQSLMTVLKDLPADSPAIEPMTLALRWVWGAGAILALLTGSFLCSFKCPALPKDKAAGRDGDSADSERQDEVKSRSAGTPVSLDGLTNCGDPDPFIRIIASPRIPVTRILSSENVSGSRVAMMAAPGCA